MLNGVFCSGDLRIFSDHGSDGDSPFLLTERYDLQAFLGIPGPVSRSEMNFFWVAQITQG